MHKNVEILIGRLVTDRRLQKRFAKAPYKVFGEQNLELTEVEMAALAAIAPDALRAFSAALDARLCRASLAVESDPASPKTSESNKQLKENIHV